MRGQLDFASSINCWTFVSRGAAAERTAVNAPVFAAVKRDIVREFPSWLSMGRQMSLIHSYLRPLKTREQSEEETFFGHILAAGSRVERGRTELRIAMSERLVW